MTEEKYHRPCTRSHGKSGRGMSGSQAFNFASFGTRCVPESPEAAWIWSDQKAAAAVAAQKRKRVATEKWSAHMGTLKARVAAVEAKRARRASLEVTRDAGVRPDMGIADPAACPLDPSNPSMARVRTSHRPMHLVRTPLQGLQYMHHQRANSLRICATQ